MPICEATSERSCLTLRLLIHIISHINELTHIAIRTMINLQQGEQAPEVRAWVLIKAPISSVIAMQSKWELGL